MNAIKYYVLATTIICGLGAITMLNEGTLDIYSIWVMSALVLASWALFQKK